MSDMKNKNRGQFPPNNRNQGMYFAIFLIIVLGVFLLIYLYMKPKPVLTYNEFLKSIEGNAIARVVIQGQMINGEFKNPDATGAKEFKTVIPLDDPTLLPLLKTNHIAIIGEPIRDGSGDFIWWIVIISVGMFLLWFLLMRGGQGGDPGRAMSFGKSRARLHRDMSGKITFADVAGCEEAKQDLQEVVEFLKSPQKFTSLGAKIPKGALLVGSPGTGKTLLAKAVAGEANVPFFSVSGSEFVEMFVGVGASRVRDLFAEGRKNAPCIIFIDELDAVGRSRGAGLGGSHDEREQTLNQILVEMDGFDSSEGLIILAATNRPDILDLALMRPGRFDRKIVVDKPDVRARELILKVHTRKVPLEPETNLENIARGTPGLTGADIENLVNEAALKAARDNRKKVNDGDFEFAKDKILLGPERKSKIILDEDKLVTAYHESGHAVLGHFLPLTDPIHKITVIPRGFAAGVTFSLPVDERTHLFKERLLQELMVLLAGRATEEIKFGHDWISGGASNDIDRATQIAHSMVCEWGMSEKLGPVSYGEKEGPVFLGKDLVTRKNFSEKIHETIDNEIRDIITDAYKKAKDLVVKYKAKLDKLAKVLLEREVLNSEEINEILGPSDKDRFPIQANLEKNDGPVVMKRHAAPAPEAPKPAKKRPGGTKK
ncbi:MAG: hypothetical protein A2Y33_07535 [Spirochaetes bacterium GWF1_51_8]|nr:MAG: hypothetical protein A2Y33_07535 [Spirochaetes bacterium GWF1_51_8]